MNTLKNRLLITKVEAKDKIYIHLSTSDVLAIPYSYTKRLESVNSEDLKEYRLIAGGIGVNFPKIDEDISLDGIINYKTKYELLAS